MRFGPGLRSREACAVSGVCLVCTTSPFGARRVTALAICVYVCRPFLVSPVANLYDLKSVAHAHGHSLLSSVPLRGHGHVQICSSLEINTNVRNSLFSRCSAAILGPMLLIATYTITLSMALSRFLGRGETSIHTGML